MNGKQVDLITAAELASGYTAKVNAGMRAVTHFASTGNSLSLLSMWQNERLPNIVRTAAKTVVLSQNSGCVEQKEARIPTSGPVSPAKDGTLLPGTVKPPQEGPKVDVGPKRTITR